MNSGILNQIGNKDDYMKVIEAALGVKTDFTEADMAGLLAIYQETSEGSFGFTDKTLVKAILAMEVPGANLLDKPDADALAALSDLCKDREPNPEKAATVKDFALSGDVSQPLALALARAALDAYAGQRDLTPFREDIKALAEFLKCADEDAFSDASMFLLRVRERVQ